MLSNLGSTMLILAVDMEEALVSLRQSVLCQVLGAAFHCSYEVYEALD